MDEMLSTAPNSFTPNMAVQEGGSINVALHSRGFM